MNAPQVLFTLFLAATFVGFISGDGEHALSVREIKAIKRGTSAKDVSTQMQTVNTALKDLSEILSKVNSTMAVLSKLANFAAKIGPAFGAVGAIFSIVSAFLPEEENPVLKAMNKHFKRTFNRLDDIDRKIDYVMAHIDQVAAYTDYKRKRDSILALQTNYKHFLRTPEEMTKEDFERVCGSHNPTEVIVWFHQRVVNPRIPPYLLSTVVTGSKYNMKELKKWSGMIMADMVQLGMMEQSCLGFRGASEKSRKQRRKDSARFMREMAQALLDAQNTLQTDWRTKQLQNDLKDKLSALEGTTHENFATATREFLEYKYDWLSFAVSSYEPYNGGDMHWVTWYSDSSTQIWRTYGRNIVAQWTPIEPKYAPWRKSIVDKAKTAMDHASTESSTRKPSSFQVHPTMTDYLQGYLTKEGVRAGHEWRNYLVVADFKAISMFGTNIDVKKFHCSANPAFTAVDAVCWMEKAALMLKFSCFNVVIQA